MSTCADCRYMSEKPYFSDYYHCGKQKERRADALPPLNLHTNLDTHFRTFFDATPNQKACKYFEQKEQR